MGRIAQIASTAKFSCFFFHKVRVYYKNVFGKPKRQRAGEPNTT